jgi:hypothetical protein
MVIKTLKCTLENKCGMNKNQINLTLLSLFTIIIQGVGFYFIDKEGINVKMFLFVIVFGFIYNILYYKTYVK